MRSRKDDSYLWVVYLLLTWVSGALTWDSMPGMLTLFLCRYFKKTSALRLASVQACNWAEEPECYSVGRHIHILIIRGCNGNWNPEIQGRSTAASMPVSQALHSTKLDFSFCYQMYLYLSNITCWAVFTFQNSLSSFSLVLSFVHLSLSLGELLTH